MLAFGFGLGWPLHHDLFRSSSLRLRTLPIMNIFQSLAEQFAAGAYASGNFELTDSDRSVIRQMRAEHEPENLTREFRIPRHHLMREVLKIHHTLQLTR
jgi:hypothetical protein